MKKNFKYGFSSPRIGEIINTGTQPAICIAEKEKQASVTIQKPNKLFHYCNKIGFKGIIASNSLWLSSLRKTNDPFEIIHLCAVFNKYVDSQKYSQDDSIKINKLRQAYYINLKNSFSSSLTVHGDLSNMWKRYGDDNNGYVLGFSTQNITDKYDLPEYSYFPIIQPSLLEVNYEEKCHKKMIKDIIRLCTRKNKDILELALYLSKISCLCKKKKWEIESEWRLLHFPSLIETVKTIEYDSHNLIKKISNDKYAYTLPPNSITDITIGRNNPTSIKEVKEFLSKYLKEYDIEKINICKL